MSAEVAYSLRPLSTPPAPKQLRVDAHIHNLRTGEANPDGTAQPISARVLKHMQRRVGESWCAQCPCQAGACGRPPPADPSSTQASSTTEFTDPHPTQATSTAEFTTSRSKLVNGQTPTCRDNGKDSAPLPPTGSQIHNFRKQVGESRWNPTW